MGKLCKVVMLPQSDKCLKPNDIVIGGNGTMNLWSTHSGSIPNASPQHLFFISEDIIKKGDTFLNIITSKLGEYPGTYLGEVVLIDVNWRKVEATNDKNCYGYLPSIPLQWICDVYVPSNGKVDNVCLETICEYGDECPSRGAYDKQHLCKASLKLTANNEVIIAPDATENFIRIVGGEPVIKAGIASATPLKVVEVTEDVWVFERSSGYAGYRNKNTGDWIHEHQYEIIRAITNKPPKIEAVDSEEKDLEDIAAEYASEMFAKITPELWDEYGPAYLQNSFVAGFVRKEREINNLETISEAAKEVAATIPYDVPVIAYKSAMNKCIDGSLSLFNRDYYRTGFYNGFLTAWKAKEEHEQSADNNTTTTIQFIDWLTKQLERKKTSPDLIYEKDKFYLWNEGLEQFNRYEELTSQQLYELYLKTK